MSGWTKVILATAILVVAMAGFNLALWRRLKEARRIAALRAEQESDEALQRANTRIVELEKQLRDKKAFAENVMSELNNTEDHLKTCGQRVDMLEDKVREMEGVVIN